MNEIFPMTLQTVIPLKTDWQSFKTWLIEYSHGTTPIEPAQIDHLESLGQIKINLRPHLQEEITFLLTASDAWEIKQITYSRTQHQFVSRLVDELLLWA